MVAALNLGLRQVMVDVGMYGHDSVVIDTTLKGTVAAPRFFYALDSTFIPDGTPSKPIQVMLIANDGTALKGLKRVAWDAIDVVDDQSAGSGPGRASTFAVQGRQLWTAPGGIAGDTLKIQGPVLPLRFTLDRTDTTNVPDAYRHLVVYYAVWWLAKWERPSLAAAVKAEYDRGVAAAGGVGGG